MEAPERDRSGWETNRTEKERREERKTEKRHFLRTVLKATMLAPITNFTVHSAACPRGRIKESSRTRERDFPGMFQYRYHGRRRTVKG